MDHDPWTMNPEPCTQILNARHESRSNQALQKEQTKANEVLAALHAENQTLRVEQNAWKRIDKVANTLNPKPETRNPKPETRKPKPETRNPKPETRNPKPETRNPKPETRNPKPEP